MSNRIILCILTSPPVIIPSFIFILSARTCVIIGRVVAIAMVMAYD